MKDSADEEKSREKTINKQLFEELQNFSSLKRFTPEELVEVINVSKEIYEQRRLG